MLMANPIDLEFDRYLDELGHSQQQQAAAAGGWHSEAAVIERARQYLAKCPPAVSGQNGSAACYRVACVLRRGFGLTMDEAFDAIRDWNAACEPPWSEHELRHKLKDAEKADGPLNYLRATKPENFERVKVPAYSQPKAKKTEPQETPAEERIVRTTLREAAMEHLARLQDGTPKLIRTGIQELDYAVGGGFEFGEMVVVGARPGHGKSAFAMQALDYMIASGTPCAMMSEEMSKLMLGKRITQLASDIPEHEWAAKFNSLTGQLERHFSNRAECHIVQHTRDVYTMAEEIGTLVKTEGVRIVCVDYLQLLKNAKKSRYEIVTESSVVLRQCCSENKVLMFALAQIGRGLESRESFIPNMSDLKESGQIEQDADVVLFLVWPHKIQSSESVDDYWLYVAKNRSRETKRYTIQMRFEASRQRIVSAGPADAAETQWAI
jgi:archaellum biogenesis ATPase FlaH